MLLFYKLIISAANLQSGNQLKQQSPIKKLLLNGTTFFYYPIEMYNGNFHTGTLYKNYSGASFDMCVTNGMDYNFYVENGQNSLKMGFYYAVPESLICTNHYDYCSHNLNPNERVIHYDPLINLNCEPNINYKMNFCQECRKYYFFYSIENEETNHFEQQVNGINKKTTQSNKTEATIGLSTMRKNSDKGFKKHNKNTGTVNVKSKDLEFTMRKLLHLINA